MNHTGFGVRAVPTMDFETYSEAGHVWNPPGTRPDKPLGFWSGPPGAGKGKKGLSVVGAAAYAEHPSTEVLSLSYDLLDGRGVRRWRPGFPPPLDLWLHLASGGLIEAHNVMFERLIWFHVCVKKYGWPPLPAAQLRCSMATAHVNSFPGALGQLSDVLRLPVPKDKDGTRLLGKFSVPRNPTKKDPRTRIRPEDDPEDAENLYRYNDKDVISEMGAVERMEPMSPDELAFWQLDQEINWHGLGIDRQGVRDCIAILNQAIDRYGAEMRAITGGLEPTQVEALRGWLAGQGVNLASLDAETLADALATADEKEFIVPNAGGYGVRQKGMPPLARRVLEIRDLVGSASVKKLFAMELQACADNRLRNLIVHHGARTGRPTGEGPQPLNLPKEGPKLVTCGSCGKPHRPKVDACLWCGVPYPPGDKRKAQWVPADMVDAVLEIMATRSLDLVEWFFGDAVLAIMGCVRSLFVAAPGHDLIASDFSAIEAVVIAELAGEEWRREAFQQNKPIYLLSASKITGTPLEVYEQYNKDNGEHHPDRQKIGKVAELGLGFGGWINAWLQFDKSGTFTDQEIKGHILAWREASPAIGAMWGGQSKEGPGGRWDKYPYLYGVEGAAVWAIQNPGEVADFRGIKFQRRITHAANVPHGSIFPQYQDGRGPVASDKLVITLLSGRELTYHEPQLAPSTRPYSEPWELAISYMTYNSNPKYGAMGWVRMSTFGGRLTENIVQATAHDILRYAIVQLWAAGYRTVLHVYDEIIVEVPEGFGSIAEVERIMGTMPPWCAGWPVRASGGWRAKRYRKG